MDIDRRAFLKRAVWASGIAGALGRPGRVEADSDKPQRVRVRIWCEGTAPKSVYPHDIDGALFDSLGQSSDLAVKRARLDDPAAGLSDEVLEKTDVLIWWGRCRHGDLPSARARAVVERVKAGRLGLIALHASCSSKPFKALMGTACEPDRWRNDGQPERVGVLVPAHPIAHNVQPFTIPRTDMFAEPFEVPTPESVIFLSSWDQGETFRSGLTWTVGKGRVAYFRPGNDNFPVLFHPSVRRVIANATLWAARRA